jgi:hypothetical protein
VQRTATILDNAAEANRVNNAWPFEFRERMRRFGGSREPRTGETAVSFKIRVNSGCFHREHSPQAYEIIDQNLRSLARTDTHIVFEEHESGPEILAYVALAATGLGFAAQVINLITAIIKARSEGIKKGDHPTDPMHLIVRRVHDAEGFREEQVLTIGHTDTIDEAKLQRQLTEALRKLLKEGEPSEPKAADSKSAARKKPKTSSRSKKKK